MRVIVKRILVNSWAESRVHYKHSVGCQSLIHRQRPLTRAETGWGPASRNAGDGSRHKPRLRSGRCRARFASFNSQRNRLCSAVLLKAVTNHFSSGRAVEKAALSKRGKGMVTDISSVERLEPRASQSESFKGLLVNTVQRKPYREGIAR